LGLGVRLNTAEPKQFAQNALGFRNGTFSVDVGEFRCFLFHLEESRDLVVYSDWCGMTRETVLWDHVGILAPSAPNPWYLLSIICEDHL
jgi:hypothetical protein